MWYYCQALVNEHCNYHLVMAKGLAVTKGLLARTKVYLEETGNGSCQGEADMGGFPEFL